jgi:MFS family permease
MSMLKTNIRLLSVFNFFIGFNLFWPIAILYFSKISGSYLLGGSVLGIIMLASTIFELPTGILSDMVGRKYTMVLGSWARVIAFLFYAIGLSYWILVAGAIFEGLSRAFYSGNNNALLFDTLADNNAEDQFVEYQGKVSSTEQLAMGISAILGGIIAYYSFSYLVWISLLPQVMMLITSYGIVDPKLHKRIDSNIFIHTKEAMKLFIQNRKLRLLSMASIINFSISELKWGFTSAFIATVWPVWAIGIPMMLSSFGASLSFFYSGNLIKRFKEINILLFDSIYGKIISLVSLGFPTVLSPLLMSTPSVLFGVGSVAESTLMQREFTNHQRATMSSLNSLGGSLGYTAMSLVLGSLADLVGAARAMFILTLIGLPAIYLYWLIFKNDKEPQPVISSSR